MTKQELITWGTTLILPIVGLLVAGKGIRRIFLLPFEYLARRTPNKIDDQVVNDVSSDLGITPTVFKGESNGEEEEKTS